MMSLLKPIVVTALVVAWSGTAWGCDCRLPSSPAEAAKGATVFVGEVVERAVINEPIDLERGTFLRQQLRFRVIDLIQSTSEEDADFIDVLTGMGGGDCGLVPDEGSLYLIYAYPSRDSSGRLETSICTRSRAILCAEEDLNAFGRKKPDYLQAAIATLDQQDPDTLKHLSCIKKPQLRSVNKIEWPSGSPAQPEPMVVKLTLKIDASGNVLDAGVDDVLSMGKDEFHDFRQEVLQKVETWKFKPATYRGRPVAIATRWTLVRPEK